VSPLRPRHAVLLLVLVATGANLPSLVPGFIHDDHAIVEKNDLVRDPSRLGAIFTKGYWNVSEVPVQNLYRPLTILSFALNHAAGGDRPFGYRLVNLALHVLATLLLCAVARRVFGAPGVPGTSGAPPALFDPPLVAALLFAVHPVHTEVLGMVVGRAELLSAAGTLGCVLLFLRGREREAAGGRSLPRFAGSIACLIVGFLSKENAVVAPALALAADLLLARRRPAWRFHAVAAAALAGLLALRAAVLGGLVPAGAVHDVDNPIVGAPFFQGRLTALAVLARYAVLLVAPLRLSIDYSFRAIPLADGLLDPWALGGAALVAAWAVGLLRAWRRSPAAAFALAWTGISAAPVANLIFPIGTIMAERLLYLPSAGFCLLAALGLERLRARFPAGGAAAASRPALGAALRLAAPAAAPLILLALGLRSELRYADWRDDHAIFASARTVAPRSVKAHFNYGAACEERGEDAEAARAYLEAMTLWSGFADAHYNLAGVYARQKRWPDAVAEYQEAVRLQPGNVKYLVNLGHALLGEGKAAEARDTLRRALEIDLASDRAHTILGSAYLALGDPAAALEAYAEAARLDPGNADYQRNLALAHEELGDPAAAVADYRRGLGIRPGDPDLLAGLGMALLKTGDRPGALSSLEAAARARPGHPIYRYNLGGAYEQAGRLPEAVAQYRESIRLAPSAPVPRRALGLLLHRLGDGAGALEALERATALDPGETVMDAEALRVLEVLRRGKRAGSRPDGRTGS
jgi:tetratricopeptide (TPR) repeat protein